MLTVEVLGPVAARVGDRGVDLRGRKQRTLLALLALAAGRPVTTERLVDGLWGEHPPADAGHALQAQVSRLRRSLDAGAGGLVRDDHGYRLDVDGTLLDATRFTASMRAGRAALYAGHHDDAARELRDALELWSGPAFGDVADSPGLRARAVALDEQHHGAVTDRIEADLGCGRHHDLVAELEELVAEHPLHERSWSQLLIALDRCGRQADALAAYRRAATALDEHAGVEPGPQLAATHQAVLHQRVAPPPAGHGLPTSRGADRTATTIIPDGPAAPGPDDLPPELARRLRGPFAGRAAERARLDAAWSDPASSCRLVLLAGEPGIGKSRLAAEFAHEVAHAGGGVRFGRCDESLAVPYQPFVEVLRDEVSRIPDAELADRLGDHPGDLTRLLPELAARLPDDRRPLRSDPETERYRLFDAVASWLAAASTERPLLVVVDDLQWSTAPTLLLLRHLVRTPMPHRALIVATYRDDRVEGPLTERVADLQRDREAVERISLDGIDREAVGEVLGAVLTDPAEDRAHLDDELVVRVYSETGGNPFFVVEVAHHLDADQAMATPELAAAPAAMPDSVRDVIRQRLRRLDVATRTLLATAAVAGRGFDARVAQLVPGLDDDELDRALDEAARNRLLERVPTGGIRRAFVHDLVRATLYDDVAPVRRLRLHGQVGETIEQLNLADLRPVHRELAYHFAEAADLGHGPAAVGYLTLAGDAALAQHAPQEAADEYRRALALLAPTADVAQRCDLLTALGVAQLQAGEPGYRTNLLASADLARTHGDAQRLATAALQNSRGWWSSAATLDTERIELLRAALEVSDPADRYTFAQLLASLAVETVLDPARRLDAVAASERALGLAREQDDRALLAAVLADHSSVVYAAFADPHGCIAVSAGLVDLARDVADPGLAVRADLGHAQNAMLIADLEVADRYLDRAEGAAAMLNQPARLWMARTWQAARLGLRGRLDEAEAAAAAAFELGSASGQPDALTWFAGQLFMIRWDQGRLHELVDLVEEQVATQADGIPAWRAAQAVALVEADRHPEAEAILDGFLASDLADLPRDLLWLHGMAYLCTVCAHLGRTDAAAVLHDALAGYGGLLAHNGTVNAGPVDAHLGAMSVLAGEPERAEQELAAAQALCERIDAPVWLARVRATRQQLTPA